MSPSTTTVAGIARFVADLAPAAIPAHTLEKARLQQASAIAAALAARLDPGAAKVAASVLARGEPGRARVLAAAGAPRAALHGAVLANASASCAFDWDEILLIGHPGHSAVMVPLALADARPDLTLADALTAQVAANEIASRLGLACFFGPQNGQNLPFIHLAGAAAAAAKLLRLDAERTAHAIAIAFSQPPAALWPAFLGAIESKVLTAAHPAEIGLAAAEMAAAGLEGPLAILDHPRGFFGRFSFLPLRRALGGLGRTWLTDTLEVKTHAACWYFQAPLDAAAEALARLGRPAVRPDDVRRVRCGATMLAVAVHSLACGTGEDRVLPNTLNFRLDRSIALLLLAGRLGPRELAPGALAAREAELRALAAKVEVRHDLDLTRGVVGAIDEAIDLAAILGESGLTGVLRALARARAEFRGMPGLALSEVTGLARDLIGASRALSKGRGRAYDLADRAEALANFAPPCGGDVEIELQDGTRVGATREVPAGALSRGDTARTLVIEKLKTSLEIAGADPTSAERLLSLPLDDPASRVLDLATT